MRIPACPRELIFLWLSVLLPVGSGLRASAFQAPPPSSPTPPGPSINLEMPHDPDALMLTGARLNSLTGEGMQPWQMKLSYTVKDAQGAISESGTLDELWASPHMIRTTYTVGTESRIVYVTEDSTLQSGTLARVSPLAQEAVRELVQPLPSPAYIERQSYEFHPQQVGSTKLTCVAEKAHTAGQVASLAPNMYCFSSDKPILRVDVSAATKQQAVRNTLVVFQGRIVPRELQITELDKISITVHLETLAAITKVDDADFTPPAEAKPTPRRIAISAGVAQGLLIKSVPLHYPPDAKAAGVSGTVVIQIKIGIDGHVHDPEIVSGPPELRQAALDAVKESVYRPYVLNGETVEVDTTANFEFHRTR